MFDRLSKLFRGKPAIIRGTQKLAEGHSKKVEIGDALADGKLVLLCRVEGRLHALDTHCPHEGGRLIDGPLIDGKHAICPLHNYTFDPRTGAVVRGSCPKAKKYAIVEKDGDAEIWL